MNRKALTLAMLSAAVFTVSMAVAAKKYELLPRKILLLKTYVPVDVEGTRKCPICGVALPGAAVKEPEGNLTMDGDIENKIAGFAKCDFIAPGKDVAAKFALDSEEDRARMKALAEEMGAGAVFYPVLLRYSERVGNSVAASKPAAVAFHLYVLEAGSMKILWQAMYSEEQQPLSSNILDFRQAFRRRFKWVTAARLASDGIDKAFNSFPGCEDAAQ